MPVRAIDFREVKNEAKELIKTASVPPLRLTAMFLLISLALNLVSTAAGWMLREALPLDSATLLTALPHLSPFSLSMLFVGFFTSLLYAVLYVGFSCYCLGVHRGKTMPYVSLFDAFPFAGKVVLLMLLEISLLFIFCIYPFMLGFLYSPAFQNIFWLLFFIAIAFYILMRYGFAIFHLCDDSSIGVFAAMRRSREETRLYMGQYSLFLLSFLPLLLLAAISMLLLEYYVLQNAFPDTLSGELLYTLASGLASTAVMLYLTVYLTLSKVGFYRRVTEPPAEELTVKTDGNEENRLE